MAVNRSVALLIALRAVEQLEAEGVALDAALRNVARSHQVDAVELTLHAITKHLAAERAREALREEE